MSGAVADNPEYATSIVVRRSRHRLFYQTIEGSDAILGFAAAENPGVGDVPVEITSTHAKASQIADILTKVSGGS